MTPAAVSEILRQDEISSGDLYPEGIASVRYFESNTLASNRPIEDSHSEAILHPSQPNAPPGMLFGVYDGHGGASCGIVTANRLQHYVATGLMSKEDVSGHLDRLRKAGRFTIGTYCRFEMHPSIFSEDDVEATQKEMHSVLTTFNDEWEMVHDLKKAHQKSYVEYVAKMLRARVEEEEQEKSSSVAEKITAAFLALDEDMSKEGIDYAGDDEVGLMTSTVALSGAVAVVAHVEGPHLHIASCGDCVAVLGT